jgi:adenylate kinase
MIILITGSPCTGKSELAKRLAEKIDARVINITEYVEENNLSDGYDEEKDCMIVDEERLAESFSQLLDKHKKENLIIEGHLAHFIKEADICIVLRCDIEKLYKRLKARGYKENKVKDNVEAEIFGVCEEEAREIHKNVITLRTSEKDIDALVNDVIVEIKPKDKNDD